MPAPFVCSASERPPRRIFATASRCPREQPLLAPAPWPVLSPRLRCFRAARVGGVAERLKAHAWKVCMRETVSRVRIPPPPPEALGTEGNYLP